MPKTVALVVVHGMGDTPPDYHDELEDELADELDDTWNKVVFKPVYYQDVLQASQAAIFKKMRPHIDWKKLRKFLLFGFSDAASLEHKKEGPDSAYTKTQAVIRRALEDVFDAAGGSLPVVLLAQSLGGQVMSNYISDAQKRPKATYGVWSTAPPDPADPKERFARLESLERFYTTGCNIPIFVAGHQQIDPIQRPTTTFKWFNFFDEDDVLGWPLKPLSSSYRKLVTDIDVNAGGGLIGTILKSWNPFSHEQYWEDSEVLDHLADTIRQLA